VSAEPQTSLPSPTAGSFALRRGADLWLHRVSVLTYVFVCAVTGVLLILLPWGTPWTDNYLLLRYSSLRPLVASGFFRGICSGLGMLDIWVGFWEAAHYNEYRPPQAP
jgi:hypothetical protein